MSKTWLAERILIVREREKKMDEENNGVRLAELADGLMSWKAMKKSLEEQLSDTNKRIAEAEEAIYKKLQAEELEKFAHAGQLFYPYVEAHPSVNKEKEEAFFSWLEENNEDGIIKRSIHPMTLKGWYRQNVDRFAEALSENGF